MSMSRVDENGWLWLDVPVGGDRWLVHVTEGSERGTYEQVGSERVELHRVALSDLRGVPA